MPKRIVSGEKSKNPGRVFLQYDPAVKGDLPTPALQASYDTQAKTLKLHGEQVASFRSDFAAYMKEQGATFEPVILLNYGKVAVAIDDGSSATGPARINVTDWSKVGLALAHTKA